MNIGVFFGSKSTEHDISIITGVFICKQLQKLGYQVTPVYIDKDNNWIISDKLLDVSTYKDESILNGLKKTIVKVNLTKSKCKMVLETNRIFTNKKIVIDLVFPAFHGINGEDGSFQGMCEILNVPYVGCGILASAISINKVVTKLLYQRFNIPTTKFTYFQSQDWINNKEYIIKNISENLIFPVFVKPSRLGSSIGINKVKNVEDLENAIEIALAYDYMVLVEESVENLVDLTICLKGTYDNVTTSEIQESKFNNEFFSYQDKYIDEGGTQFGNSENEDKIIIPANLDLETYMQIKDTAIEIYKKFGCTGIARIDFLYDRQYKKFYANEINTIPGTFYHHLWKKSGIDFSTVLNELINYAFEEYKSKNKLTYTFKSDVINKSEKFSKKLELSSV
ncbi:MAG: D-alanine--D-alanine ligase [Candidatus Dojkabacteria bacterium]|nr:D-alanine--D-alanine ligase [Candidatus Dojkabacteria bacterium]